MLFVDNNLSPKLATRLADLFPGSVSAFFVGLEAASDREIRQFAQQNGLHILTKDRDFNHLFSRYGFPPKVIRLDCGNRSTREVEAILRGQFDEISHFIESPQFGLMTIRR